MPQKFKYYLHDGSNSGERREHLENEGVELSEEAWNSDEFRYAFYEVTLDCEIDDKGNITILKVS